MTADDSQSCLGYFNKLVDEYNNSHQPSENLFMLIILLCLKKLN